jgi:hypothetical protein
MQALDPLGPVANGSFQRILQSAPRRVDISAGDHVNKIV